MYSKKDVGIARSLNLEDIEKHFTEEGKNARDTYSGYNTEETNTVYTYYPSIYDEEKAGNLSRSQNLVKLTKEDKKQNGDLIIKKTAYSIDSTTGDYIDNTKFKEIILGTGKLYWHSSRFSGRWLSCECFGLIGVELTEFTNYIQLDSSGDVSSFAHALRPVVSLEAKISLELDGEGVWNIK